MDELSAFLHSPAWERFQNAAGARVERDGDNLFIHRSLARRGSYWISSRCSVPWNWEVPEFAQNGWFVRLEPEDQTSYENLAQLAERMELPLHQTVAVQPRQTTVLDLTMTPEALLAKMKSKHRYNIRLAEKHGVEVEIHTERLLEQFPRFWKLLQETAGRHTFRIHPRAYYEKMLKELGDAGLLRLGFARKDDEDLAAILVLNYQGVATYLHGASTTARRELMAPHLLHWRMITLLQKENARLYDFWGTNAQPTENGWEPLANHPSAGTTRFKLGFGGEVVEYPGCFDLVLQPFWYNLYKSIRGLRSRKRAFS